MVYLVVRPQYRAMIRRFSPDLSNVNRAPIWVQAASVGEVLTAKPILQALEQAYPDVPILLTTGTVTGMEEAKKWEDTFQVAWFPFDHPFSVSQFFNRIQPRCLILIETELWPNVLHKAHQHQVPVLIINGRLSEKNFGKYEKRKGFFKRYLAPIQLAAMQTQLDADRILQLGVKKESIELTGNVKFDGADLSADESKAHQLREELGIQPDTPLLVVGSTRPGEEALIESVWRRFKQENPDCCLIVAPRHIKRLNEATEPFGGYKKHYRSQMAQSEHIIGPEDILFLDTLGELKLLYSLATVAVMGGSFNESVQGHNPIEPAALGIPTVFGPHMKNFLQPASILTECGGARQVNDSEELLVVLLELFNNAELRQSMGKKGQQAVRDNQGAVSHTVDLIERVL